MKINDCHSSSLDYIILLLCCGSFQLNFFWKLHFFCYTKQKNIHHLMMINRLIYWSIDRSISFHRSFHSNKREKNISISFEFEYTKKDSILFLPTTHIVTYFYLSIWSKNTFEFDPKTSPLFCSIFKNEKKIQSILVVGIPPEMNEWWQFSYVMMMMTIFIFRFCSEISQSIQVCF